MTTNIVFGDVIAAVDELWTDNYKRPSKAPFKKFYVMDDSIIFLSGHIDPILVALATYVEALGIEEDYIDSMSMLVEMEGSAYGVIEVDRATGQVLYSEGVDQRTLNNLSFYGGGSGSEEALTTFMAKLEVFKQVNGTCPDDTQIQQLMLSSMEHALRNDECSGGDVCFIQWSNSSLIVDNLCWVPALELDTYHSRICQCIEERFVSKEDVRDLIAMMSDEEHQDAQALEFELKMLDQNKAESYLSKDKFNTTEEEAMKNNDLPETRVATHTAGLNNGKPFKAASLKARMLQRKAEGRK
ncbi:hypothetical protein [Erwinia phyllosphaerae]|uniref:hypothetical protein n=1 Tax=Erwinia phyllosphaerae TaxID=2853256 RepID=UPI001FF07D50|nr:hypothetical protein [Erwinia phyllosphaerae]MBV4366245.1 hypothetical protein [Erwinia phyllosphaerae]